MTALWQVTEHLAGFFLKCVYQNPDNGFCGDRPLDKDDVRRLVGTCTDRLLHDKGTLTETIRMQVRQVGISVTTELCTLQVHYMVHYRPWDEAVENHRRQLEAKLAPITRLAKVEKMECDPRAFPFAGTLWRTV